MLQRIPAVLHDRYCAVLCDPPWDFQAWGPKGYGKAPPYSTSPVEAIARAFDINSFVYDDCVLFLWTVDANLEQALELLRLWEFEYKTIGFIWVKTDSRIGMGYWTRKGAEICLLATRGHPKRISKAVRQVIYAPRREHSRKPDETYRRIERLVPGPYLEMFARQSWPGWSAVGNETDKFQADVPRPRLRRSSLVSPRPRLIRAA